MKYSFHLLILFLLAFANPCLAQKDSVKVKKNGKISEYYKNGNLKYTGYYKKRLRSGEWKFLSENGNIVKTENYEKGVLQGKINVFENNKKVVSGQYKDGKAVGEWNYINYTEPNVFIMIFHIGDSTIQQYFYYHNDSVGKLYKESSFVKGVINGYYFNAEKVIVHQGYYKDGKEDSIWKSYYLKNTFPSQIAQYKLGKLHGLKEYFNDYTGAKVKEELYVNGLLHGIVKEWYTNGKLSTIGKYNFGKKDSLFVNYNEDGNIYKETNYRNDTLHGMERVWELNGMIYHQSYYVNGIKEGKYSIHFSDGQKQSEVIVKNGNYEGKFISWYADGKIESVSYYVKGKKDGAETLYYPNGKKKAEYMYKDGNLISTKKWTREGKLRKPPYEEDAEIELYY